MAADDQCNETKFNRISYKAGDGLPYATTGSQAPPQPTRRSRRASRAPPAGSGAEARPPTHFLAYIFGILAHRTFLVERTVLLYVQTKPVFLPVKTHSIDD